MKKNMSKSNGFTLTELMVIIGIIGLLVVIVLPSYVRVRKLTRRVVCASNLRTIGMEMQLRMDSNSGEFPQFWFETEEDEHGNLSVSFSKETAEKNGFDLLPDNALVCPSDDEPDMIPLKQNDGSIQKRPCSYGYNVDFFLRGKNSNNMPPTNKLAILFDGKIPNGTYGSGYTYTEPELETPKKVHVMHIPPGNPAGEGVVEVSWNGWIHGHKEGPAHLHHQCHLVKDEGGTPISEEALLAEYNGLDPMIIANRYSATSDSFVKESFNTRHINNSGNVLYADWHVEFRDNITDGMVVGY